MIAHTTARSVACDDCLQVVGRACTDWRGIPVKPHRARINAAMRVTREVNRKMREAQ